MFYKFSPWDFEKTLKKDLESSHTPQIYAFLATDPFLEGHASDVLKSSWKERQTFHGGEVSCEWFQNTLLTPSLFGSSGAVLILCAQELDREIFSMLEESYSSLQSSLAFFFTTSSEGFLSLKKNDSCFSYQIQAPGFWQSQQTLRYLLNYYQLKMDEESQSYFLDSVPFGLTDYSQRLHYLKISSGESNQVSYELLTQLLSPYKVDHFELASLLSDKKLRPFFEKMISLPQDFEVLRSCSQFLLGHLLKIVDPAYIQKKTGKVSNYDRSILEYRKHWSDDQLFRTIDYFKKLELLCREKDELAFEHLRSKYLEVFR